MEAPTIIKMEQEIDREMMIDAGESVSSEDDHIYEPEVQRQKVAADFKSLDEMVSHSETYDFGTFRAKGTVRMPCRVKSVQNGHLGFKQL